LFHGKTYIKGKRTMNNIHLNDLQKYLSTCLLATAALLVGASPAWAQVSLGTASGFSVLGSTLGGTNVTCTDGVITGDVGVSPQISGVVPFTNTRCTVAGGTPPATDAAAAGARTAFLSAYGTVFDVTCDTVHTLTGTLDGVNLAPGNYCLSAEAKTGTLTLKGGSNDVWVFRVSGALSGNSFTVVMDGGQPCNVFWAPIGAAATMVDSNLKGNILAGDATLGAITLTRGTLAGRALANLAVTITGTSVIGCDALSGSPSCKGKDHDGDHDKDHKKCNQGVGNGSEDCDPGHSDQNNPFGSNDEHDGDKPGDPGRKGGKS
jgi:hypothetical protein